MRNVDGFSTKFSQFRHCTSDRNPQGRVRTGPQRSIRSLRGQFIYATNIIQFTGNFVWKGFFGTSYLSPMTIFRSNEHQVALQYKKKIYKKVQNALGASSTFVSCMGINPPCSDRVCVIEYVCVGGWACVCARIFIYFSADYTYTRMYYTTYIKIEISTPTRVQFTHRTDANVVVRHVSSSAIIYRHLQIVYLEKLSNEPYAHKFVIKKLFFMCLLSNKSGNITCL